MRYKRLYKVIFFIFDQQYYLSIVCKLFLTETRHSSERYHHSSWRREHNRQKCKPNIKQLSTFSGRFWLNSIINLSYFVLKYVWQLYRNKKRIFSCIEHASVCSTRERHLSSSRTRGIKVIRGIKQKPVIY